MSNIGIRLTVMTAPARTIEPLNVCCVVLAAFSTLLRSFHGTRPSSLTIPIAFRLVRGVGPVEISVAYKRRRDVLPRVCWVKTLGAVLDIRTAILRYFAKGVIQEKAHSVQGDAGGVIFYPRKADDPKSKVKVIGARRAPRSL